MDKRTLYAVVASTIIIIIGFSIQRVINENRAADQATDQPAQQQSEGAEPSADADSDSATQSPGGVAAGSGAIVAVVDNTQPPPTCQPYFNNGTVEVTFSATDAGIESFKLLRHFDDERPLDLIFKGQTQQNPFTILVGDRDGYALTGNYSCSADSDSIRFTGRFAAPAIQPEPFDITITYTFVPDEYLFQQEIEFRNSVNRQIPLAGGAGAAGGGSGGYTLFIGPQIGPEFAMLDNRSEFRKYITLDGRDRDSTRLNGRRTDTLVAPPRC